MDKGKLCGLGIAGMIGFLSLSPITTFAAETNTESVTQSENNKTLQDNNSVFKEKMKKASEKWKTLTSKQKEEVYSILEEEMKTENKLMDKLVEFEVLEKEDAELIKARMLNRFNKTKESGEFPFIRQKDKKRSK
ncbi:MAG: DUF2680 domain-containing protein [Anaerocolumna sp.]